MFLVVKEVRLILSIRSLKKHLGCGFFLVAGFYMLATKPPDLISVIAIISCIALALLSMTTNKDWAAIGGGLLIAGSILLQSVLLYRCLDCIRADIIILVGVITLSIMERGRYRMTLIVLSLTITIFMVFTIIKYYNPLIVIGGGFLLEKQLASYSEQASSINFDVITLDGRKVTLNSGSKSILIYSPSCGACIRAVEAMVRQDPEGKHWVPVQSYGEPEQGWTLLTKNGYQGQSYVYAYEWQGPIPALITTGKTISIIQEMLETVGSDNN